MISASTALKITYRTPYQKELKAINKLIKDTARDNQSDCEFELGYYPHIRSEQSRFVSFMETLGYNVTIHMNYYVTLNWNNNSNKEKNRQNER